MIAQISAEKIDAESGNLMEKSVSDGKTVAQAPRSVCINRNVITVPVSNFQERLLVY